ncbi:ATP-binding protein [Streptomyces sp. NPDC020807]|uniref:ATP-binding protein n=1 Tax=Streptomyces sp. NPDC020807 TaxID=3155119 RepID=UPI0033F5C29E
MSPTLRTVLAPTLCPAAAPPRPGAGSAPSLAYSLTLPGDPRSAAVARAAVSAVLRAHGLDGHSLAALLVVTELVGTAARLAPGVDLHLFLRHRADALRILVWDQHPAHPDPDVEALCADRRRRSLWLLDAAVDDWGGEWGGERGVRGVKSWVTLPR